MDHNNRSISVRKVIDEAKKNWLALNLKSQYAKLQSIELETYELHMNFIRNIDESIQNIIKKKRDIHILFVEKLLGH